MSLHNGSNVLDVVPLITASGAGAASRSNMGLVIASGLSIRAFGSAP